MQDIIYVRTLNRPELFLKVKYLVRMTHVDLIGEVLQKGQVRSTRNKRACMIRCMNVDEARAIFKDRSRLRSVVSAYPHWKIVEILCIYVCIWYRKEN